MAEQVHRLDQADQVAVLSRERPREINMAARWERVAEVIRQRIRDGVYTTDGYLPSYRLLAQEFAVSVGTIRTAYLMLRVEGWIEGEPGVGVKVREDHPSG